MIQHSSCHLLPEDFSYIEGLAQRNFVGEGMLCESFALALGQHFKRVHCMLTNTGASALEIALHVLRQSRPGFDDVILSAYVCPAVVSSILREGLRPVFADIQEGSMNLDAGSVSHRIGARTLAVIMTHAGGNADPVSDLLGLGIPVISDCAQAIGSKWNNRQVTVFGEATVTSFGSTKMLTVGSGGALFSDDETFFSLASHHAKEEWQVADYKSRGFVPTYGQHYSDLLAGLGQAHLKRFDKNLLRRSFIAHQYTAVLVQSHKIILPTIPRECEPNNFRYYFFSPSSQKWIKFLQAEGIDARPSISHNMIEYFPPCKSFVNLERNTCRLVSLPIHTSLSDGDIARVLEALEKGIKSGL
jgi:perosamine synthetase